MIFLSVKIENFLAIGSAEVSLANRGLLLIQGENQDETSAVSNGSGKSSLVDAICFCLYGVTARDVSGDAVVNRTAGKGTRVQVVMQDGDGGDIYTVTRHRKHAKGKNSLQVLCGAVDLSKGTDKETQVVLDGIIGCSLLVFQASIYAGQEQMPDLPGMTDRQLKLLIEEAAGTEVFAAAYTEALRRKNTIAGELELAKGKFISATNAMIVLQDELGAAEEAAQVFEGSRRPKAQGFVENARENDAAAVAARAAVEKVDLTAIDAKLSSLDATLRDFNAKHSAAASLVRASQSQEIALARAKTTLLGYQRELDRRRDHIRGIRDLNGKPCVECGKPHDASELATLLTAQKGQLQAAHDAVTTATADVAAAQSVSDAAKAEADSAQAALPDVSELSAKRTKLGALKGEVERQLAVAAANDAAAAKHREMAKAALIEPNPHAPTVERLKERVAQQEKAVADRVAESEAIEARRRTAEMVAEVFGPAGVRAHILDTVTPFLNDRTRHYLSTLSDGSISAVWTTLSHTAAGELREKFTIEVSSASAATFSGHSGGEKRKVRLACAMALQDLVASRASKPIDLFLADEIDDALDDAGLERLMTILNEKAKLRGTVMVISHRSLRDWIDNVIEVTKKGGIATVAGAI